MTRTVWLLTKGSYSDYGVVGVYATEDLAREAAAIIGYEANDPEEIPVRTDLADFGWTWGARVAKQRRSGEPTVYYEKYGGPRHREPGEVDVDERVDRSHWRYVGRDRDAVNAAARAQSQAIHGIVLIRALVAPY